MSSEGDALRVWFRLLRLQTRSRMAISNRLRRLDLSVPQCDVLTTLTEREGLSQQELAALNERLTASNAALENHRAALDANRAAACQIGLRQMQKGELCEN